MVFGGIIMVFVRQMGGSGGLSGDWFWRESLPVFVPKSAIPILVPIHGLLPKSAIQKNCYATAIPCAQIDLK